MMDSIRHAMQASKRWRESPLLTRFEAQIASLSPGDKVIAGVLASLVVVTSLIALFALKNTLLVEVPTYGGSLTEGIVGSPRFVNPLLALSDADRDVTELTYAGLMGVGEDGALVPVLAESYDITEGGTVYTFILREGLEFSDGSPLTAEDVVFTVLKAQDSGLKSPVRANWEGVLVEAVDARTVRFTLPKAYAPFLENARMGILPARLWRNISNEEFPFSTLQTEPVGAGPFVVSGVGRNASGIIDTYKLVANKKFAIGRPYLDTIRLSFFAQESDVRKALLSGAVDSAYGVIVPEQSGRTIFSVPYSRVFGVFFNASENPLFARSEVRKALSLSLDRETLVEEVLGGTASPAAGPVPPGTLSEDTPIPTGTLEERVAEAAEVLEKGGWTYDVENRIWARGTGSSRTELHFTLKTSNVSELKAVAGAVKDMWEKLGVPVSIELYEPGDLNQNIIRPRSYEALLFGMVVGRDRDLYAFWHSSQRNDPGLNIALYANKAVDALLDKERAASDASERDGYLKDIQEQVAADYPAAFTHTPDFVYTVPRGLRGVALTQIAAPSDRFARIAYWYRQTDAVWPFFIRASGE